MKEWSGRLQNYKNLKVFGVLTFAYFKKDKLDEKTKRCIFVGYIEDVKAMEVKTWG